MPFQTESVKLLRSERRLQNGVLRLLTRVLIEREDTMRIRFNYRRKLRDPLSRKTKCPVSNEPPSGQYNFSINRNFNLARHN